MNRFLSALLVAALAATLYAQESLPPGAKVVRLEATPASVALKHPYDYRQLLITAVLDSGDRIDATRMAKIIAPTAVKPSAGGQIRPVADGTGELKAAFDETVRLVVHAFPDSLRQRCRLVLQPLSVFGPNGPEHLTISDEKLDRAALLKALKLV